MKILKLWFGQTRVNTKIDNNTYETHIEIYDIDEKYYYFGIYFELSPDSRNSGVTLKTNLIAIL